MTEWATFAAFAGVVTLALLLLAYASQATVRGGEADASPTDDDEPRVYGPRLPETDPVRHHRVRDAGVDRPADRHPATNRHPADATDGGAVVADDVLVDRRRGPDDEFEWVDGPRPTPAWQRGEMPEMTSGILLANVAVSQGLFAAFLLFGAWFTGVPASAFGVTGDPLSTGLPALGVGVGVGLVLYALNELGAMAGERFGVVASEDLRAMLAPDDLRGWAILLLGVLPLVAVFEELLFRGALVGVMWAGFGVSPWLLAALSSVAFALGHGAQGPGGILVTGLLGFVLAVTFVLTGSLLVVVVAHYLVNALEFVVHEGLGFEWS
jgi:membrane protease YdiL (CAAX protease family)